MLPLTPANLIKTARRQLRKIRQRGPANEREKQLIASADLQRTEGMGFRYDGFGGVSTPELFALLAKIGLEWDEDTFRTEAALRGSPTALSDYFTQRTTAVGRWKDLMVLGMRELWRRLFRHVPCPEVVADEIDDLLDDAALAGTPTAADFRVLQLLLTDCTEPAFFDKVARESGNDLIGLTLELLSRPFPEAPESELKPMREALAKLIQATSCLTERLAILTAKPGDLKS